MTRMTDEELQRHITALEQVPLPWATLARAPDAFTELAELRRWATRTVQFLKAPESNAELINIVSTAQRLGIE